jgi:hypothetical protein
MDCIIISIIVSTVQWISYEWETHTDLQDVHGTTSHNIEMASHCFRAANSFTTYSYGYRLIYGSAIYSTTMNVFPTHYIEI